MTANIVVKCRNCRRNIIEDCENHLVNAHNLPRNKDHEVNCLSITEETNIFLNEENLPLWISNKIQEVNWSKGRLNCTECDARIGGFDFISGHKCECLENPLPPVHFIKSKVDLIKVKQ
ncbi:unnamed protein product [Brassicogethes aeneus]|uniref:E3 ubiquitin-protein ligase n=1 Tax=Brassicogethes aeneus TaxID=1431903 RepID=A0A9P0ARU5_BRAAE|nr:unnamed protein product [Brassicogethes aeneus]